MTVLMLIQGTAQLLPFADKSIHTIVTSPPYFRLRQYDSVLSETYLGGQYSPVPDAPPITIPEWEGCLGNEPVPSYFVWHTLLWLRECWRVLRDDGTLWLNLGDSAAGAGYSNHAGTNGAHREGGGKQTHTYGTGYPAGTLLGIPQQVFLAAIADGWIVRNECVWAKAAPMPESVTGWSWRQRQCPWAPPHIDTPVEQRPAVGGDSRNGSHVGARRWRNNPDPDCPTCGGTGRMDEVVLRKGSWRHTRATESIFQLVKGMQYFADGEAVREKAVAGWNGSSFTSTYDAATKPGLGTAARIERDGRNPRNVLTPSNVPFPGAHFATFPPSLIEPLIRASCPAQCCPVCGMGWAPVVTTDRSQEAAPSGNREIRRWSGADTSSVGGRMARQSHGYAPSCSCITDLPPVPGVVLDPFSGSGTTVLVARALGRRGVGIEASPTYLTLARERLGLEALAQWAGQGATQTETRVDDLPLWGG